MMKNAPLVGTGLIGLAYVAFYMIILYHLITPVTAVIYGIAEVLSSLSKWLLI